MPVAQIVSHLGYATGGRPAGWLVRRSGVGLSDGTVLRQLKIYGSESAQLPSVFGVDDWSWKVTSVAVKALTKLILVRFGAIRH